MVTANFLTRTSGLVLVIALILSACETPKDLSRTGVYHEPETSKSEPRVLNAMQMKALQAMNQQRYDDAITYLQHAIRIAPRDALNWHYLAQNYWHKLDFKNCRAMTERARAYIDDKDLAKSNDILHQQCTPSE